MKKWLAAVLASVAATVVAALVTDWFGVGDNQSREAATPSITAFNPTFSQVGQTPTAKITVENQGDETAESCILWWEPGNLVDGSRAVEASDEFSLQAHQSRTFPLTASDSWTEPVLTEAKAWIICSNTESSEKTETEKTVIIIPRRL